MGSLQFIYFRTLKTYMKKIKPQNLLILYLDLDKFKIVVPHTNVVLAAIEDILVVTEVKLNNKLKIFSRLCNRCMM